MHTPSDSKVESFKKFVYNKYLHTLSEHITHRFPDVELLEAFSLFDASAIPEELNLHGSHGQSELEVLIDHYGHQKVVHPEAAKSELKVFNSVVAANRELKQLTTCELMTRILSTAELETMLPNLWSTSSHVHVHSGL